jgi:hypothetical protein
MSNELATNSQTGELQIEVFGTELAGRQFIEQTRTLTIHRDGATIPLANKLAPDSELIIRNPLTNQEALARVVDLVRDEIFVHIYAITFVDSSVNLWQVAFPEARSAKTITLECSRCHAVEAVSLNEIETDVFESKLTLTRHCECSKSLTTWMTTDRPVTEKMSAENGMGNQPQKVTRAPGPGEQTPRDRRKGKRTSMNFPACIRSDRGETIVECEDVSRGGFRFKSRKAYPEGTRVETAVPYAKSSVNIFVSARIAYTQALSGGFYRHGVAYVKAIQQQDSNY